MRTVKLDHLPQIFGVKIAKKYLSCHHPNNNPLVTQMLITQNIGAIPNFQKYIEFTNI